jgi:tetratricopeptide (TPR) repeat protein
VEPEQRLSDINKAVFHLRKAATLYPNDPRVYFQLGTVLGAKMETEKSLLQDGDEMTDANKLAQRAEIAAALEKSALFEAAAVKLGIHGIEDLTSCLNALAQTHCEMGEFSTALRVIDQWAECGSIRSSLAIEDISISDTEETPCYEWLTSEATNRKVAVKTMGDAPLFNEDDIQLIVAAADRSFAQANGKQLSRYTMQYVGNSEVHLDDLCANDPVLKERVDHILQNRVYPLVRKAFAEDGCGGAEAPAGPLCVYDSIFVRYNGDQARLAGRIGASQPLHQDGGIYSVNIALNSHKEEDENGFTGGGTFLEGLARDDIPCIQRPNGPGHALLHHTVARHAGVSYRSIVFLPFRQPDYNSFCSYTFCFRLQQLVVYVTFL